MAEKTLLEMGIGQARKTTVESREAAAAAFFQDWKVALRGAQKKGLFRWQFKQRDPVTYHDTNAATKVTKAMAELGFKLAWVPRTIEKTEPINPFGEFLYIRELRVWWHNEMEHVEELSFAGEAYFEGMPREGKKADISKAELAQGEPP